MILTCPNCATRYFVSDDKLGAEGRTVRCASCGTKWKAAPEAALDLVTSTEEGAVGKSSAESLAAPEEMKPEALPAVFRARAFEKKTMRRAMVHGVVWAGMLAVMIALLAAAVVFRVDIVRLIPRAAGAFATVGLPVNPTGLVFEKISARPALEEGHSALVVSGQVRNIEDREVTIPAIRIEVLDSAGKPVAAHVTSTAESLLKAGESRHFVVSLRDPPATAKDVEVAFLMGAKPAHAPKATPGHAAAPAEPVLRSAAIEAAPIEPVSAVPLEPAMTGALPQEPAAPTAEEHH